MASDLRPYTDTTLVHLSSNLGGPTGGSMASMVADLQAAGITPLLVFWLSCSTFEFSTLDVSSANYWKEHWELYKHTYMGIRWAYRNGVTKFEFWCAGLPTPYLQASCERDLLRGTT